MRIDRQGNVGIGTTTPGAKLAINLPATGLGMYLAGYASGTGALFSISTSTASATTTAFQIDNNGKVSVGSGTATLDFNVQGQSYFSGNVGIGTTSPAYKLDVAGFINTDQFSGYKQAGNTILYASSTSFTTFGGINAGTGIIGGASVANVYSTAFGYNAMQNATTSQVSSTAFGYNALKGSATISNTGGNSAFGYNTLTSITSGSNNSAFGSSALGVNTSGADNNAFGRVALQLNTTGTTNNAFGEYTLQLNTSGTSNSAFGHAACAGNTTGAGNNCVGNYSLRYNNGSNNVANGSLAGLGLTNAINDYNSLSDSNMTFIGALSSRDGSVVASTTSLTNGTAIGYGSQVGASNSLVLGGLYANAVKVGVGTSTPYAKLSIHAVSGETNTTLFAIASSTASATTTLFSILNTGNVGIGTTSPAVALDVSSTDTTNGQLRLENGGAYTSFIVEADGSLFIKPNNAATFFGAYNSVSSVRILNNIQVNSNVSSYFNGTGNLGIGTTSPYAKLSVSALNPTAPLFAVDYGTGTATSSALYISSSGNVGIGTTSPGSILSIQGVANFTTGTTTFYGNGINIPASQCYAVGGTCLSSGGGAAAGIAGAVQFSDGATFASDTLFFWNNTTKSLGIGTSSPLSVLDIAGVNNGTSPLFQLSSVASFATTTRFIVTNDGNVGIGTTSPFASLSIVGDTRIKRLIDSATAFVVENSIGSSTAAFSTIDSNSNIFEIATSTGSAYFDVTSDGFVGIGTTSPWRQLSTTGTVAFSGLSTLNAATSTTATNICLDSTGELVKSGVPYVGCMGSSERYKHDIQPLDVDSIAIIKGLHPMSYIYNGDTTNSITWGFIAEEANTIDSHLAATDPINGLVYNIVDRSFMAVMLQAEKRLLESIDISNAPTTTPAITIDVSGNVGIGAPRDGVSAELAVSGDVFADAYETPNIAVTSFTLGTTMFTAEMPAEVLTAMGNVNLYKLATYNLSGIQALMAAVNAQNTHITALEARMTALESSAISSVSGSPIELSTTSLASVFESLGAYISKGIAQFGSLIADRFVAATNSAGTSSAGTVSVLAGNVVAEVSNAYVTPMTKVFITFNASVTGSWYVADKQAGSFRVVLSTAQAGDVSFDYFLVQTEGQIATSTAEQLPSSIPEAPTAPSSPAPDPAPESTRCNTHWCSGTRAHGRRHLH
ncbi:MAG: tail fiber domain-containing protein [Candidatus Paceibacterota bacterium]